ncbi:Fur family transcriptional regulator [Patescibacteria group bacterium]
MITNKERLTNHKHLVLNYLESVKSHPSAEEVYKAMKKKLPRISLGTVYRILKNMGEKGNCQQITHKGVLRFDADTSSHHHFICEKCNKIDDFFLKTPCFEKINGKSLKIGKIKNYQVNLYGICKKCQKKGNNHEN